MKITLNTIFYTHVFSFLYTVFINPGIPERKYYSKNYIQNIKKEEKSKYIKCKICNIITPKELKVSHCYYCNVCVINQDHHCTFFGKCVGKNNCFTFYLTLVTIPLLMITAFITLICYAIYLDQVQSERRRK